MFSVADRTTQSLNFCAFENTSIQEKLSCAHSPLRDRDFVGGNISVTDSMLQLESLNGPFPFLRKQKANLLVNNRHIGEVETINDNNYYLLTIKTCNTLHGMLHFY